MTERDRITFYIMIGMQMTDRAKLLNQSCNTPVAVFMTSRSPPRQRHPEGKPNPVSAFVNHGQHMGQNAH